MEREKHTFIICSLWKWHMGTFGDIAAWVFLSFASWLLKSLVILRVRYMCLRQRPAWWCKKGRALTLRWQQWGFSMRHELPKLSNQWWRIALMLTFSPWLWDTGILYSQDSLDSVGKSWALHFSWSKTCCRCTIFMRSQAHVTVWISHKNMSKTSPKFNQQKFKKLDPTKVRSQKA